MRLSIASVLVLACSMLAPRTADAQYGYDPHGQTGNGLVRCESIDGRTRECPVDTRGGVRLVRQISRTPCAEGRNWGYGRYGIWVSQGCRAEFVAGYGYGGHGPDDGYGGGYGRVFRCESNDGRWQQCRVDTRRGIELVRQLSRTACIRGDTWGWNDQGVWVARGCRGEFRTRSGWGRRPDEGQVQVVRCESNDGGVRACPVDPRGGVRLVRQLSRSACVEGHSWGVDRGGIWVSNGCRAEFEVGHRGNRGYGRGRGD